MKKIPALFLGILLFASVSVTAGCGAEADAMPEYAPDSFILIIDPDVVSIASLIPAEDIIYAYRNLVPGMYAVKVPAGRDVMSEIAYLKNVTGVLSAEPNYYYYYSVDGETPAPAQEHTAQSPFPVFGVLAGAGAALVMLRWEK
ncbi:MAG: hypothetical protein Q4Q04_03215 [Methanocorpusculum sp.]|nr:hypothetical protein [Methanocorpusculum sp.]